MFKKIGRIGGELIGVDRWHLDHTLKVVCSYLYIVVGAYEFRIGIEEGQSQNGILPKYRRPPYCSLIGRRCQDYCSHGPCAFYKGWDHVHLFLWLSLSLWLAQCQHLWRWGSLSEGQRCPNYFGFEFIWNHIKSWILRTCYDCWLGKCVLHPCEPRQTEGSW